MLAMGCKPATPDGTTPPGEDTGSSDAAGDAGSSDAPAGDSGDAGASDAPAGDAGGDDPYAVAVRTECPADVNQDMPVSVFEDKMLIRLPKGVQDIVEDTPFSGYINPRPAESTTCVDGVAGATIINGETGFFKDDPRRPMGKVLNDVLFSTISFPETSKVDLGTEKGSGAKRTVTAEVTVPAAENKAESKAFVMLKSAHGRMHYLVYECETPAWNALKATFKESAKSMLLLNPDG